MAIVKNFWLVNQKKKLGGAVIYQAMGQTRSRELAASVTNPRTQSQMTQRVRWANLVNLYRANRSWMRYAFETKKDNQSEYNKFMSLNAATSRIFLTKLIASLGGCVVDNYQITQGSLPSIETIQSGNTGWDTNIFTGSINLGNDTTIAVLSAALIAANPAIREGDQLSFVRMTQLTNQDNGVPYVVVREYEMVINSSDGRLVKDFLPLSYITTAQIGTTEGIFVNNSGQAGGFALILSRTIGGKTYVSSQRIVVANNAALISAFSSANALQNAIDSYGEQADAFLSSTIANEAAAGIVPNSIVSVQLDETTCTPGTVARLTDVDPGGGFSISLSSTPASSVTAATMKSMHGGQIRNVTFENLTTTGSVVSGDFPANVQFEPNEALVEVSVTIGGQLITTGFAVPNDATIEGLE